MKLVLLDIAPIFDIIWLILLVLRELKLGSFFLIEEQRKIA